MKHIFSLMFLFVTTFSVAQQINPVPDYIFRNQMSVGRNAPTDTAAYLSVGPRYGANKGLMPPMVVDTNAVTGVKRNGLLIFSVQLNNFAYWDSTTSRFRKITAEAVVDSVVFATRAWRKKGDDSLGAVISQRTDTALLSTKAYRQKGVDSLVTLISTLGGGTVLSVSAGTGMNFTTITTSGSVNADTNVLATRANRDKLKDSLQANIAGKVNISDTATMLSAYLRKADTTSMLSPYLRKTDTTAMLTPYVRNAGFGLTKGTQTLSVDSALMATRARVQKGIDSVASLVTTTDSVVFSTRAWRQKGVDSVAALANTKATATGTTNYLSKFTGTSSLGNSIVYATTSEVGISTPSPTHPLDVNGRVRVRTIDSTATGMNMLYADNDGVIKKAAVPAGGSGTVTSVAAGTGMSFTTITTTGSVSADTVALATRAWRQKGIDSVANVRVGGSGTTNRVAKFTASGTVGNGSIADSSSSVQMTILSGGNVGIGTTSPTYKVDIVGGLRTTGGANFATSSGDVGIGTATPSKTAGTVLNMHAIASSEVHLTNNTTGTGGADGFTILQSGNDEYIFNYESGFIQFGTSNADRMRLTAAGRLLIGTTTEGTNTVDIAGTLRSTQGANFATSSGNVGIGTTSPISRLHVNTAYTEPTIGFPTAPTTLISNTGASSIVNLLSSNTGNTVIQFGDTDDAVQGELAYTHANDNMLFVTNSAISGRIDASQRWLVGSSNSPTEKLDVDGKVRIRTIDSTSSPINLLTSDVNGVIRKTAVPASVAGSGNTNYIPKWTNATALGNSVMYEQGGEITVGSTTDYGAFTLQVDGTQYVKTSLAVGNTSPSSTLDVTGTMRSTQGANFATSSGEVLMGNLSDQGDYRLQVGGNVYVSGTQVINTGSDGLEIGVSTGNSARANFILKGTNAVGSPRISYQGINVFSTDGTLDISHGGNIAFRNGATVNATITSTGNVGIGTTSPSYTLDVTGTMRNTTSAYFSTSSGESYVGTTTDVGDFKLQVSGNQYVSGLGAFGTTSLLADADVQIGATSGNDGYLQIAAASNGIAQISFGDGTGNDRFAGYMQYYHIGDSLIIGTASAPRFNLNATGLGLGTAPSERLDVNGRARVRTIDSSGSPINMLWADNNGVIRKAAVPAGGGGTVTSVATGFGIDGGTITSTGTLTADTVEMATRARVQKGIDSVGALARVTGSGTTNYVPLWTGSTALGNSSIYEASTEVLIGTTSDAGAFKLQVSGVTYSSDGLRTGNPNGGTAATWKLGSRIAGSYSTASAYLEVDIGGTLYYIGLVTPD